MKHVNWRDISRKLIEMHALCNKPFRAVRREREGGRVVTVPLPEQSFA